MNFRILDIGIYKNEKKELLSFDEYIETKKLYKITPYNSVQVSVAFLGKSEENEKGLKSLADKLVTYYKKNKAKNIEIVNCWTSTDKVYNGLIDEWYYAGWIEITFEKDIKSLGRSLNNLELKVQEMIREIENEYLMCV